MKICKNQQGSALLLSLWALLVLSVAVFALAKYVEQGIGTSREANLGLDAQALAHSGLVIALNQGTTPQTPALFANFGQNRGFQVKMVGEGGKLNLNALLLNENPARLDVLKKYLASRGLKFDQIQRLVDCMLDWVDPDNLKHLNGAEDEPSYHPTNRPFQSLDEVAKVRGSEPLVTLPHWQDDFTIYGDGVVDLQWASVAVISAFPGVGEDRARLLISLRQGKDKLDGTRDDHILILQEALSYLGLPNQPPAPWDMVNVVPPANCMYHITSVGTSAKVHRQVEVVAQSRNGNNSNILLWKEN